MGNFIKLTDEDGMAVLLRASAIYKIQELEVYDEDDAEEVKSSVYYNTEDGATNIEVRESVVRVAKMLGATPVAPEVPVAPNTAVQVTNAVPGATPATTNLLNKLGETNLDELFKTN